MRKTTPLMAAACLLLFAQGCKRDNMPAKGVSRTDSKKQITVDEVQDNPLPTGTYKFVTHNTWSNSTNYAMHPVGGVAAAENALVEQSNFTNNNNGHEWRAIAIGGGKYNIFVQGSLGYRVLTVLGTGTMASGNSIGVRTINSSIATRQEWIIEFIGMGMYQIKLASNTSLAVNITPAGSVTNGAIFKLGGTTDINSAFMVYRMGYKDIDATNFFKRDDATGWNAGDGTGSIKMSNNKVLWMMDDSNISTFSNGTITCNQVMVNNAGLLQNFDNWTTKPTTLLGTGNTSWIKSQPGTSKYNWVTCAFEHSGIVYMYCTTLNAGVNVTPSVLAKYNVSTNTITGYQNLPDCYRADLDANDGIRDGKIYFGRGFATVTDGGVEYIYAYGAHVPGSTPYNFHAKIYVARVPKTAAAIAANNWTYWTGTTWSTDHNLATIIGTATTTVPFVAKVNNRYVLVSSELSTACSANGNEIFTSATSSPTGPFPAMKSIYTIDDKYNSLYATFYWGMPHPEYINANNELLITYNLNASENSANCGAACVSGRKDPNRYRPRAIRVPLKLIDATLF